MTVGTLIAVALITAAPVTPKELPADAARSALALMREGIERYDAGEFAAAEAMFRAAALAKDAPVGAVFNEACALYRQGDLEGAARAFREAAAQQGAAQIAGRSAYNLGLVGLEATDQAQALELDVLDPLPQVFGADPEGAWQAYADGVRALIERYAQAGDDFREAIAQDPEDQEAARNFALTRQRIRELQQEREAKRRQFEQLKEQMLRPEDAAQQMEELAEQQQEQAEQNQSGEGQQTQSQAQQGQQQTSRDTQSLLDQAQLTLDTAQALQQQQAQQQQQGMPEQSEDASGAQANEQLIEQAKQALEEARAAQERAEESLEEGDQESAAKAQQDAAETLQEAAEQLREAMEQQQQGEDESQDGQQGEQQGEQQPQASNDQQQEMQEQQASAEEQEGDPLEQQIEQIVQYLLDREERQREQLEAMKRRHVRPAPVERDW